MTTPKSATDILAENIEAWTNGKRTFFATVEELHILCAAGGVVVQWNYDNKDGTYSHEVQFGGYTFRGTTPQTIQGGVP